MGYRIELGEVEASLAALEQVEEGVVVFKHSSPQEIGALVVPAGGATPDQIQTAMKGRLPNYMVPTTIKVLDGEFPRTPNGKYDRKAITAQVFPE